MFYDAVENKHGLKYDPFKALIVPRPIGWITSLSEDGVCNLAPYSFFNAVSDRPHYVMFSSKHRKDSIRNIEATGEFTWSMSTWETRLGMNTTSAPVAPEVDEYEVSGLETEASQLVKPPRVKAAPAAFECRYWKTVELPDVEPGSDQGHFIVIGQVVGIYINDDYVKEGMVDSGAMLPLARLGYMDYGVLRPDAVLTINRPQLDEQGNLVKTQAAEWDGVYR